MRRIGAIALVLLAGLACAIGAQAKPQHQALKCKPGYVRRTVWIPKRVHGRIVRRHGRIVRIKVRRCVKPKPRPKPSSPASPPTGTTTNPTPPRPGTPTVPSPTTTTTTTTTTPPPSDQVVVAVGDIACAAGDTAESCKQSATEAIARQQNPNAVLVLGDNQYDDGSLSEYEGAGAYGSTWGVFNPIVHPVPGNHEYGTSGAAGYFKYFGTNGVATNPPGGYYSFNLGSWHIVALNSNCSNGCQDAVTAGETSAEMSWLQSDLDANKSACVLAMWHHPLFSYGWTLGATGAEPLWAALYSAHADVVLNGHDHIYERYDQQDPSGNATPSGIREFVVGTGGESLNGPYGNSPPATLQAQDRQFGVLVLTLHATSYSWRFVATSGATLDSGTTACHGPGATTAVVGPRRPATPVDVARLAGPPLVFDAHPIRSSLVSVRRVGVAVAVLASRAVNVRVTAWLRHGRRLTRIASFYETESQITKPHSVIRLHLPTRGLSGTRRGTLVLRFAAEDAAGHRHTVTRTVRLG